jgi:hypothetical protein
VGTARIAARDNRTGSNDAMNLSQAREILQRLFDPMPLDTFLDEVLDKKFIKLEGKANNHQRELFLGDDPAAMLLNAFGFLAPKITSHAAVPLGPAPASEPLPNAAAFRSKIEMFHARGYTVRLPELRALTPELDQLMRALEFFFYAPVGVESFWSRSDAKAPIHHDDYDIIVIQLYGRKRWFISTDVSELPNVWKASVGQARLDRFAEVVVEPGDLLYLPRGTTHRVDAITETIHLSIGFLPLTLREAVIACLDQVSDLDRPLREAVSGRLSEQIQAANFGNLSERVRKSVGALLKQTESDALITQAIERRSSRVIGGFSKLAMPPKHTGLTATTVVRHNPLAVAHISDYAGKIDFAYPGGHHYIHAGAEPSVRFIAATPQFRIREIPGAIGDDVRIALVDKLVTSGFLEVVEGA